MSSDPINRLRAAYPPLVDADAPSRTLTRLQAAYDAADTSPPADPERRSVPRRVGLLAFGAVVMGGTAIAAGVSGWHPQLGSPVRAESPSAATAGVPAEQLRRLAVLRRPQRATDRGGLVPRALRILNRDFIDGVHVDAIRVIDRRPHSATVLIPAESGGIRHADDPRAPSRDLLCLQTVAYQPPTTITTPHGPTRLGGGYGGGGTCGTTATLMTTGIRAGVGESPIITRPYRPGHGPLTHYVTLVPDGVARVAVRLRGGRSVTVPVRDNVYHHSVRGIGIQLGTVWYDAAGNRIDHRTRP